LERALVDEKRIGTVRDQIRSKIELQGLDPKTAAEVVLAELIALGVPDINEIVPVALKQYQQVQNKIEYLQVATIPRRRRTNWYGGPTSNGIWAGLERYLLEDKGWDANPTVNSIDDTSSKIVSLLDNPGTSKFATRSLVVGYVQSGKTANMTAVTAKAVDANYKFIIVLAGMTDALRSQTQARIEKDLIDQDPDRWHAWTTLDMDFSHAPDAGFPAPHPASRHYAVIKKNKWILQRLLNKLEKTPPSILRSIPFLIIDDECDQASVNASKYRDEMTAINGLVRQILHTIPRCAYIGYTATPFANVLIDPAVSVDKDHPDDLYPRDFIVALPRPPDYFGAENLFGRGLLDADEDIPDADGLDMIRIIEDEEIPDLRPANPKEKDSFSMSITESLDQAIRYYLMASAARNARGQEAEHSSMLIHTTMYVAPHFDARLTIAGHVKELGIRIKSRDKTLLEELRSQWNLERRKVDSDSFNNRDVEFEEILEHLERTISAVEVVVENGVSEIRLEFSDDQPRRYIVVGGSVLARGLTIEGLVVSFFLRTSSQYDTLMQMGRWFGYRQGYEDFPRVWMTRDVRDAFKDLATVEAEIRNDIDIYRERDISPLDFAIRIRQIPGMSITSANKMLASETCDISYADEHIQTTRFKHNDMGWLENNWQAGEELIKDARSQSGDPSTVKRGRLFEGVSNGAILRFLGKYVTHKSHRDFQPQKIMEYIESQNDKGDGCLSTWNVGIIEPASGAMSNKALGVLGKVKTVIRSLLWATKDGDADIKALMSRGDVYLDCPDLGSAGNDKWDVLKNRRAVETSNKPLLLLYPIQAESAPTKKYVGKDGNPTRDPLNALMDVLGVGIVFPPSPIKTPVNYVRVELPAQDYEEPELVEITEEEAE
jgi:hypothetical protein